MGTLAEVVGFAHKLSRAGAIVEIWDKAVQDQYELFCKRADSNDPATWHGAAYTLLIAARDAFRMSMLVSDLLVDADLEKKIQTELDSVPGLPEARDVIEHVDAYLREKPGACLPLLGTPPACEAGHVGNKAGEYGLQDHSPLAILLRAKGGDWVGQ